MRQRLTVEALEARCLPSRGFGIPVAAPVAHVAPPPKLHYDYSLSLTMTPAGVQSTGEVTFGWNGGVGLMEFARTGSHYQFVVMGSAGGEAFFSAFTITASSNASLKAHFSADVAHDAGSRFIVAAFEATILRVH